MHVFLALDPMDEILPHVLIGHGWFGVTNQMIMALVAGLLMLLIFPYLFPHPDSGVPKGSKNLFESTLEFLRLEVFRPALKDQTDRFVPFLWTLFFFILFCNLLGQLPIAEIVTLFTGKESHWGGTATGTPTTTGALAICAFFMVHVSGILQIAKSLMNGTYGHHDHSHDHEAGHDSAQDLEHDRGEGLPVSAGDFGAFGNPTAHYAKDADRAVVHGAIDTPHKVNPVVAIFMAVPLYLWNFAPHPFRPEPGASGLKASFSSVMDFFMWGFLLILELIGALIKPFSLMIRLFANMIAGHIVLGSLILLIPVTAGLVSQLGHGFPVTILSIVIRMLELFVAFLQAYIFTFLTTLFIASAVAPEH